MISSLLPKGNPKGINNNISNNNNNNSNININPMEQQKYFGTMKTISTPMMIDGLELEPLLKELDAFDYEGVLFQSYMNEGKHQLILNSKHPLIQYDEKQLRDAAAAEVATYGATDDSGKSITKKRKGTETNAKVQDSRDRNREHAKNTRLRKKAYVIKLKELSEQLERRRREDEMTKRANSLKIMNTNISQGNVMRLFLNYRQRNVQDRSAWEGILDNHFVFTLPITPYRSFLKRDVVSGSRMLVGIDAVIADVGSLHLMVESVGQGSKEWKQSVKRGEECLLEYSTNSNDFHFSGDKAMCKYTLRTVGFKEVGAVSGCEQHGMILCRFNPNSNKLVSVEMVFDVMAFMQQLQRAAAITPESSVIPNTVEMALQGSKEARAIMKSDPPFPVLHINAAWTELSGIPQSEAEDMPLSEVLRLMPSQFENLYALVAKCSAGQAGSAVLITHCAISPEQPALVYLKMLPLTSNTEATITHFLGIHTDLPLSVVEKKALLLHCKSTAQNVVFPSSSGAALGVISVPQEFHQAKPMPIMFSGSDNRFHDLKKADEFSAESSSSERISGGSSSKKSSNFAHSDLPSNFHGVHASRGSRASSEGSSGNAHSFFDTNAQSERVGKFSGLGKDPSPPLRYPVLQNMSGPRKPRIKQEGSSNSSASSSGGEPTVNSRKRFKSDRYNIDPSSHA